jgi:23S rRNA (uracil1939-C5)-methyltransferase
MADRVVTLAIESMSAAGDGLGRIGNRMVAVPFTIPGERVSAELKPERGPRRGEQDARPARLVEVLRASPHRVEAPCPHFGPCGGCTWQHIAYTEQLRLKTALVSRLVRAVLPNSPAVLPTLPSTPIDQPWGYRHKVHFVFDGEAAGREGRLVMGHYIRGSRRVLPVRECPVHDPRGNCVAFDFYAAFRGGRVEAERGGLRSLAIRVGAATDEMMATLVVSKTADKRVREATRKAISRQALSTSVHVNMHDRPDAYIFGRETRRISGAERMREEVSGTSFLLSPTAFFQTNVHAAEILVRLVIAEVPPNARVLDLYAGCGLFALPLARAGRTVTAVEDNRAAVADGEASVRLNRIPAGRCQFISKRVDEALRSRTVKVRAAWGEGTAKVGAASGESGGYDVVILDPPREGCEPSVLQQVFGTLRPAIGVYVSCNPESLGRDLALIAGEGYRIRSLQPVDMFPHTAHVETVAVLTR